MRTEVKASFSTLTFLLTFFASCVPSGPTKSTPELYHLEESELIDLKIAAIKGDVRSAERIADYYMTYEAMKSESDGLEWTIIAARLGSQSARNNLEFITNREGDTLKELLQIIKAQVPLR